MAIMGLVTFSLFILEESFQTVMFGTWPAQDAKDWELVSEGADLMVGITNTMKVVNYSAGWVQPIAFVAYRKYGIAAEYYTRCLRAKVFANRPELFVGRPVSFEFRPKEIRAMPDGSFLAVNGQMQVRTPIRLEGAVFRVSGVLERIDDRTLQVTMP
ncbi:MAG: hypothetical protein JEZ11_03935 [Desulfobacterales bacterium]|nr:hypothetical protein [Desulfobacterales bacterium]